MKKLQLDELSVQSFVTNLDANQKKTVQGADMPTEGSQYDTRLSCWSDVNRDGIVNGAEPLISFVVTKMGVCNIVDFWANMMSLSCTWLN